MGDHADNFAIRQRNIGPMSIPVYHLAIGCERPAVGGSYHLTTARRGAPEPLNAGQHGAFIAAVVARDVAAVRALLAQHTPGFLARYDAAVGAGHPGLTDPLEAIWHNGAEPTEWVQAVETLAP